MGIQSGAQGPRGFIAPAQRGAAQQTQRGFNPKAGMAAPAVIPSKPDVNPAAIAKSIARKIAPYLNEANQLHAVGGALINGATSAAAIAVFEKTNEALGVLDATRQVLEGAARSTKRAQGAARALDAAAKHAKAAGQIGFDVVRLRVEVAKAEAAVKALKSEAAASALVFMRPALQEAQAAFESERYFQKGYAEIAAKLKDGKSSALGEMAIAAEKLAEKSTIGRGLLATGKFLTSEGITKPLLVIGIGVAAIKGYQETTDKSVIWKTAGGAISGVTALAKDGGMGAAVAAGRMNPAALLFDPAVEHGARALGFKDEGKKLTIGSFYEACNNSIYGLTKGALTGDSEALTKAHEANMSGNVSRIMQGYAMIGEAISRSALGDTALTKLADATQGVPEEFRTSSSWWDAFKSDVGSVLEAGKGAVIAAGEKIAEMKGSGAAADGANAAAGSAAGSSTGAAAAAAKTSSAAGRSK
jgi:hypothetical protein